MAQAVAEEVAVEAAAEVAPEEVAEQVAAASVGEQERVRNRRPLPGRRPHGDGCRPRQHALG